MTNVTSHQTAASKEKAAAAVGNNSSNTSSGKIECAILEESDNDKVALKQLVQLINDVYDVAEQGMWKVKGFRTSMSEIQTLVANRQLIVAYSHSHSTTTTTNDRNDDSPVMVGCVKVQQINHNTGGFGMLVVDPTRRGKGIGNQLVAAAEQWARRRGGCLYMQLELLLPRTWKQPSKEFNQAWYTRLGYTHESTGPFEKDFPELEPLLATECDYTIWKKELLQA